MNQIVQVAFAICLCIILLVLGLFVYNKEMIAEVKKAVEGKKPRTFFSFVNSVADAGGMGRNTQVDPVNIPFAINQKGGAEFTYNFWMYKDVDSNIYTDGVLFDDLDTLGSYNFGGTNEILSADVGLHERDIPILLKGNASVVKYASMCMDGSDHVYKKDVLTKCPLIKIDRTTDRLTVQFNTYSGPDAVVEGTQSRIACGSGSGSWAEKTQHQFTVSGLQTDNYINKWFMVTVILKDTNEDGMYPKRNKVNCKIYINGVKMLDKYADGTMDAPKNEYSILRQNRSPLWIFPVIKDDTKATYNVTLADKLKIAGGKYFNYALTDIDVDTLFKNQFNISSIVPSTAAPVMSDKTLTQKETYGVTM